VVAFVVSACVSISSDGGTSDGSPSASLPQPSSSPEGSTVLPTAPLPTAEPPARSAERTIGYISLDETVPFVSAVSDGIRAAAATSGLPLVECDSGWSRDGSLECATQLAAAGVHGVISFQAFPDAAGEICQSTGNAPTIGVVFDQGVCQI